MGCAASMDQHGPDTSEERPARMSHEELRLFREVDNLDARSSGNVVSEPGRCSAWIAHEARCAKFWVAHGINSDPDQYADEVRKTFPVFEDGDFDPFRDWMLAVQEAVGDEGFEPVPSPRVGWQPSSTRFGTTNSTSGHGNDSSTADSLSTEPTVVGRRVAYAAPSPNVSPLTTAATISAFATSPGQHYHPHRSSGLANELGGQDDDEDEEELVLTLSRSRQRSLASSSDEGFRRGSSSMTPGTSVHRVGHSSSIIAPTLQHPHHALQHQPGNKGSPHTPLHVDEADELVPVVGGA